MLTFLGVPLGTLSQVGTFGLLLVLIAGLVTVWIKGLPERLRVRNETRQIELNEAGLLRSELHVQLEELRAHVRDERLAHATEMRAFNLERDEMGDRLAKMERQLNRQQLRHNAERALDRHRLNNIQQCFGALLMLLKANPEDPSKVKEAIAMVESMRDKMILAETEEKAIIRAAEIAVDEGECDHDAN